MDTQAVLKQIREEAFRDEMEKMAVTEGALQRAFSNRILKSFPRMTFSAKKRVASAAPLRLIAKELKTKEYSGLLGSQQKASRMGFNTREILPKKGVINSKMISEFT